MAVAFYPPHPKVSSKSTMPTTIKPVSPFYDDDSTVPLPPRPDQVELFGQAPRLLTLLANEHLTPAGLDVAPLPRFSVVGRSGTPSITRSTPAPEFHIASKPLSKLSHRGMSPYAKKASSDDDSATSTMSDDSKIPKPQGEPGHPGRGGYTLEAALDWNHSVYTKFKKAIHCLIEEHLDTTKCASAQSPASLKLATAAFPDLENYSNVWLVTDMIMMHLKYTSSHARHREVEMIAGKKHATRSMRDTIFPRRSRLWASPLEPREPEPESSSSDTEHSAVEAHTPTDPNPSPSEDDTGFLQNTLQNVLSSLGSPHPLTSQPRLKPGSPFTMSGSRSGLGLGSKGGAPTAPA
ncbi:hypothetical protein EDC04DRAFT_2911760 [Pisolithus marmoratus]|nr:hypothetical protein EDC04DRAFT_2911760 [Pisolithus marmoratus]